MKLSEAIRMGSLLVKEPQPGAVGRCAIGMANLATNGYRVIEKKGESVTMAYEKFDESFPWVVNLPIKPCRLCGWNCGGREVIWHLFDNHVMTCPGYGLPMTIEQLADYVATIEPKEEPETEAPDVHLRDMQEVKSA